MEGNVRKRSGEVRELIEAEDLDVDVQVDGASMMRQWRQCSQQVQICW